MGNNLLQVELKGRLLIAKEILWSGTEFRSRAIATKRSGSVWVLFNPCSREGSDPWSCIPARPYSNFNPRSCEGSDFRPDHDIITFARFQSTHPRGERRSNYQSPCVSSKFQSTHPRGERRATSFIFSAYPAISIHAPARGATPKLTKKPISNWQNSTKGYLHFSKIHQNQAFLHAYLANAP